MYDDVELKYEIIILPLTTFFTKKAVKYESKYNLDDNII